MSSIIIKRLTIDDYNEFLPLINEFRTTMFRQEEFVEQLKHIEQNSEIYVAECDSKLIGCATILYEKKFIHNMATLAHIEDVCVKEEYKGRGIGKMLIHKLIEQAKINKCYKIVLDCSEETSRFYSSCNFEKKEIQMIYRCV
jgi:glucosamine-phosphate N-acetyltransferase